MCTCMCSRVVCDLPPAVPEGWTCSDSADASQRPAPLTAFIYSKFVIAQNSLLSLQDTLSFFLRHLSSSTISPLPSLSFFQLLACTFFTFHDLHHRFFVHFLPLPFLSKHLSNLALPPLCRPHRHSSSLVSLSLSWHREQAGTWEGCFVIQQVIPPWHRKGWKGRGADGMCVCVGGGGLILLPAILYLCYIPPSASWWSLPFFPPTGGLAFPHSPLRLWECDREREEGRNQGSENGRERVGVGGSVEMK